MSSEDVESDIDIDIGSDYLDTEFTLDEEFVLLFQKQKEIQEQIEKGTNLHQYAETIQKKLKENENKLVEEYVSKGDEFVDLYYQIEECESTFTEFEKILGTFQEKFSSLHERISTFQTESNRISNTLKNRKEIGKHLQMYLSSLDLSKLSRLDKTPPPQINKSFVEFLLEIEQKRDFLNQHLQEWQSRTVLFRDIDARLQRYENIVVEKIRAFFINKIKSINQTPKKNSPKKTALMPTVNRLEETKIQLLQFSYFARFLRKFHGEGYLTIRKMYAQVAQKYYFLKIQQLLKSLTKSKVFRSGIGSHFFLTGITPKNNKTTNSFLKVFRRKDKESEEKGSSQQKGGQRREDRTSRTFELGHRLGQNFWEGRMLDPSLDKPREQVDFEIIFQKIHVKLVQYVNSEYSFLIDFFGETEPVDRRGKGSLKKRTSSSSNFEVQTQQERLLNHILSEIFQPSFKKIEEFTVKNFLDDTHDLLGVFVILKYVHSYFIPRVPSFFQFLRVYFRDYNLILWPKLKRLFDLQVESISQFDHGNKKLVNRELKSRWVVNNYSKLLTSIYQLCMKRRDVKNKNKKQKNISQPLTPLTPVSQDEDEEDEGEVEEKGKGSSSGVGKVEVSSLDLEVEDEFLNVLARNLILMRKKMIQYIQKVTKNIRDRKRVMVFKINCYDLIIKRFLENDIPKNDDGSEFFEKLMNLIDLFATSELKGKFEKMTRYVERVHPMAVSNSHSSREAQRRIGPSGMADMEEVATGFGRDWKDCISDINGNVERFFPNRGTGKDILQKIFHNLLQTYAQFREIVEVCYGRGTSNSRCPFQASLVGIQNIQHEIKQVCKM